MFQKMHTKLDIYIPLTLPNIPFCSESVQNHPTCYHFMFVYHSSLFLFFGRIEPTIVEGITEM